MTGLGESLQKQMVNGGVVGYGRWVVIGAAQSLAYRETVIRLDGCRIGIDRIQNEIRDAMGGEG